MAPLEKSLDGSDNHDSRTGDIHEQLFDLAVSGDLEAFKILYESADEKPVLSLKRSSPAGNPNDMGLERARRLNEHVTSQLSGNHRLPPQVRIIDIAAYSGHESIVLYLLKQEKQDPGSLPDGGFQYDDGTTLLHIAAKMGMARVVQWIIKPAKRIGDRFKSDYLEVRSHARGLGSSPRRNRLKGTTALETAVVWGHWHIATLLMKCGSNVGVAVYAAFDSGQVEIAARLVEECYMGDECDADGETPLHAAADSGMDEENRQTYDHDKLSHVSRAIDAMMQMGVDPSKQRYGGETAWDVAFRRHNVHVMSALAEKGVFKSGNMWSPVDFKFQSMEGSFWDAPGQELSHNGPVRVRGRENNLTLVLGLVRAIARRIQRTSETTPPETRLVQLVDSCISRPQWKRAEPGFHRRDVGFRVEQIISSESQPSRDLEFISVAIPYLWVGDTEDLDRRNKECIGPISPKELRFCSTNNRCTLRQCSPLTLDEDANPGLRRAILDISNRDQVLSRHSRKQPDRHSLRHIEVRQAWAFKIDEHVIFSTHGTELNMPSRIYHAKANHSIGALIASAVNSMNQQLSGNDATSIFDAFREEIMYLSMAVNDHIDKQDISSTDLHDERRFTHEINDLREELSMMRRVLSQQEEIWREFTFHTWTRPEHWPEGPNGVFKPISHVTSGATRSEGEHPTQFSDEVSELRKELEALKRTMLHIEGTAEYRCDEEAGQDSSRVTGGTGPITGKGVHSEAGETGKTGGYSPEAIRDAQHPQYLIARAKRVINDLDEDAERVERSIQIRLDLRQKHISLRETHNMSVMGASVFAFTIITIIFTPLSFATSLFALPIDQIVRHQTVLVEDTPTYKTPYIGAWLTIVEIVALLVTFAAMIVAFKWFLGVRLGDMVFRPASERVRGMLPSRGKGIGKRESLPEKGRQENEYEGPTGFRKFVNRGRQYVRRKGHRRWWEDDRDTV